MLVIGVGGVKRAGKNEFVARLNALIKDYEIEVYQGAFADSLKQEIYEAALKPNNIPFYYLEQDNTKEMFRTLLQGWGDFRRNTSHKDYWIDKLRDKIDLYANKKCIVIATDARYKNELDFITGYGNSYTVYIENNRLVKTDQHSSENSITPDMCDFVINNNSSLDDYTKEILSSKLYDNVLRYINVY